MKRLLSTTLVDIRLQFRNGFYFASLFIVILLVIILRQFSQEMQSWLLPFLIFSNLQVNAFYFIAGLILLEKGEGTLEAQVVTPLCPREYLSAKILSLSILSLLESLLLVVLSIGFSLHLPLFSLGILTMTAIYALFGFMLVIRYNSLNEFLFPSFLLVCPLGIPLLYYFEIATHPVFFVHPLQSPLILLQAAIEPVSKGITAFCILSSMFWVVLLSWFGIRVFHRFVISKQGV